MRFIQSKVIVIVSLLLLHVNGELFSSYETLGSLLKTEGFVIQSLEEYITENPNNEVVER